MSKIPFDIDSVLDHVRDAVAPLPKAAMFALADDGYRTPFEQVVACVISIRTYDEVSLPAAKRLFAVAQTPAQLAAMSPVEIEALIRPTTFHERKARQIREIAEIVATDHGGELPCDFTLLRALPGVGPKCANLALGISSMGRGVAAGGVGAAGGGTAENRATARRLVAVDIHVHRVTNRWGYVSAPTPEKTREALEKVLPRRYDVEINALLVPFGKHICTGVRPKCSTCPVLDMCRQVGVERHR